MPAVLPGVQVNVSDQSQVILNNTNSVVYAMIGTFQMGNLKPTLLSNANDLTTYFGSYGDATDKQAYITAVQLLKSATGVYVSNAFKGDASYGGLYVTTSGIQGFYGRGVTTNTAFSDPEHVTYWTGVSDTGSGSTLNFTINIPGFPVIPSSVTVRYTKGGTQYTEIDDGAGKINSVNGDVDNTNTTLVYSTGVLTLEFLAGHAPDAHTIIYINFSYNTNYLFAMMAVSPKSWSSNYGIKILSVNSVDKTFVIGEYQNVNSVDTLLQSYTVSRDPNAIDGFGNKIFVEQVVASKSKYFIAKNNSNIVSTTLPTAGTAIQTITVNNGGIGFTTPPTISFTGGGGSDATATASISGGAVTTIAVNLGGSGYLTSPTVVFTGGGGSNAAATANLYPAVVTYSTGGYDGTGTVGDYEKGLCIAQYNALNINFDIFIGAGITSATLINQISALVDSRYKMTFLDTIDDSTTNVANITAWASSLSLNDKNVAIYSPNQVIAYNGLNVACPVSAIVGYQYGLSVQNGTKYLPPAGVDRGSINVVSMNAYYNDAQILILSGLNINVVKSIPGYGNVIFSDFTMQSKTSATSYINSVLTLNDMITTFKSNLVTINFRVINTLTFLELRSLMTSYLDRLATQQGTIEPNYKLIIDSTNNNQTTADARQIYAKLIFVFQGLVAQVVLDLTYTTNELFSQLTAG